METEMAAADVCSLHCLAYHLQVYSVMGMDDGIPGGKACDCRPDLSGVKMHDIEDKLRLKLASFSVFGRIKD